MADNYAKLWVQDNLNLAATNRALEAMQNADLGGLPVSVTAIVGSMVTVKFEVTGPWTLPPVTIPKAESQYVRTPTQVGDYGIARPAGTYLGGITGGAGVANTEVNYGNLSALVFEPVTSTKFQASPDANKAWIYGPNGAIISDKAQTANVTVAANLVTIAAASGTVQLQGSGSTAGNGIANANAVHAALVAFKAAMVTAGISGASSIVVPTVTGSSLSFTA